MSIKRVKSKSGKVYEYDTSKYKYKHKSTRGRVLVGKNGRINKNNIDAFKDNIDNNPNYTDLEKLYLKTDLDALVKQKHKAGEKLTTNGFLSRQKDDAISRMFMNAGYDVDVVASRYGFNTDALLDESNWNGDIFTYNGKAYQFDFTYYGDILTEI